MKLLRNRFKEMVPYHSDHITEGIKLDANENPYPIPRAMIEHMQRWMESASISRYPDTDSMELIRAIAKAFKVTEENVVCGVGSDELIDCVLKSTIEDSDYVVAPNPSFSMYPQFTMLNCGKLIAVPLNEDFSFNAEAIKEAVKTYQPKVVFLCNPNNPTGSLLTLEEIEEITILSKGLVVVDEAYGEFCKVTALPLIKKYRNIVILKTFSKAYSLAGARVGYGIANKEVIDLINTVRVPYNLSVFSQKIATWAMQNKAIFDSAIQKIIEQRGCLSKALQDLGVKVYPSHTNFIWVKLPEEAFQQLQESKIYIRKINYEGQPYYRITVGTKEENEALLNALSRCLKA